MGALVVGGCSSGGDDGTAADVGDRDASGAAETDSGRSDRDDTDDTDDADEAETLAGEPIAHLPFDGEASAGERMLLADCAANDDALAAAEEAGHVEYASYITFVVPEDWTGAGRSSGGSGGITGNDVTFSFDSVESGKVEVGYAWDRQLADGDEGWESFDYDYERNGTTTAIEYIQVAMVEVGDQRAELFYRDPSQAPELLEDEQYKVRLAAFDVPHSVLRPGGVDAYSLVFTFTFDEVTSEIDQDTVEATIGSINLPTCVWDELLLFEEVQRQVDLNGDGEVQSMQEWLEELQAG